MKRFEPLNEKQSKGVLIVALSALFIVLMCLGAALFVPAQAAPLAWNKTPTPTEHHHKTPTPTKKPYKTKTPTEKPYPTETEAAPTETSRPTNVPSDTPIPPSETPVPPTDTATPTDTFLPSDTPQPTATPTKHHNGGGDTDTPAPSDTPSFIASSTVTPTSTSTVMSTQSLGPLGFAAETATPCGYSGCCCCCQQTQIQPVIVSVAPAPEPDMQEVADRLLDLVGWLKVIAAGIGALAGLEAIWMGYNIAKDWRKGS